MARATLVGEAIGEKPNSYSENDEILKTDGLVTPDKEILPSWADWVAGRDPVLDWIVKQ